MSTLKAVIPPSDNVTLNINGHSIPGFKRGEEWNGFVKYTKGQNYVILEDASPQPEDGFTVLKMNPAMADKVKNPPTADNSGEGAKAPEGEGEGQTATGASA